MKKYKATLLCSTARIKAVDVERETEKMIMFADGARLAKETEHDYYADSLEDAKAWLIDKIHADIKREHEKMEWSYKKRAELFKLLENQGEWLKD